MKWSLAITAATAFTFVAGAAAQNFSASLPKVSGTGEIPSLQYAVSVTRDDLGIPTVEATTLHDALRAQGYLHAQDRYFQMDMARRLPAGELAAVIGEAGIASDRSARRKRLRSVARQAVKRLEPAFHDRLQAYCEGVNAGLSELEAPPVEYSFLQATPQPWAIEDSVLVCLGLFDMLNDADHWERIATVMHECLPAELYEFLTPTLTRFDAPILSDRAVNYGAGSGGDYVPLPIPSTDVIDLRASSDVGINAASVGDLVADAPIVLGSNSWAVAGSRTAHGGAVVANDPHLYLPVPGIWYRMEFRWQDGWMAGVTAAGLPGVAIGSNRHIAWSLTNTTADFRDLIVIEVDPDNPTRYRTPDGWEPFTIVRESIDVAGGDGVALELQSTRWGMVTGLDHAGRPLVLRWTGLDPHEAAADLSKLYLARSVDEAIDAVRTMGGPSQNVVIADKDGRIGWVVSGALPRRVGFDGSLSRSWADGDVYWDGTLDESQRPAVIDPSSGILFTANNRTMGASQARVLSKAWALGVRASRIRDRLLQRRVLDEVELRDIQLDTTIVVAELYRDLAIDAIDRRASAAESAGDGSLQRARKILTEWNGTADADQHAVSFLFAYRRAVHQRAISPLVAKCIEIDAGFRYSWMLAEEPVRRLLEEQPEHLLASEYSSWNDLLDAALTELLGRLPEGVDRSFFDSTWGERNATRVHHPMAQFAPQFAAMLNMPATPQAGHLYAVRVSSSSFGASMRMVVSPGREGAGLLHMPTGQSGHPMSPHYRDSHSAWAEGRPTPFRSGAPGDHLTLVPRIDDGG